MENDFWYSMKMDNETINLSKIERFITNDPYFEEYVSKHLDRPSYLFIVDTVTSQIENIQARQPSAPAPETDNNC